MAEDHGLCTHFSYHKHKLVLFLSAMRSHADAIRQKHPIDYYELTVKNASLSYENKLKSCINNYAGIEEIVTYDIEDHFFDKRIRAFCKDRSLRLTVADSPAFLTTKAHFYQYNQNTKKPHMASYYEQQRKELNVLVDEGQKPLHGKWSFDQENRKKLPKGIKVPDLATMHPTEHTEAVTALVNELFPDHPGDTDTFHWATTRRQALYMLNDFINTRFQDFGPYEDAIDHDQTFVFHSVLSPYMNLGLITPDEVLDKALDHYHSNGTHYPSVEGFVRQIMGWREFMRGIYHEYDGELNKNYFGHNRKMKACWYNGTTGVPPLDRAIHKAIKYGYTHHIERLMVLGNIMLLCELSPDEVYKWFMEMYVDSSDWVMAPNVYGMSQFADGGLFATKPYIGGAAYIKKMSNYGTGDWEDIVNGLYWRFISRNRATFERNPRMSMMVGMLEKMKEEKRERIFGAASAFIDRVTTQ